MLCLSFSLSACLGPLFNKEYIAAGGEAPDPATVCASANGGQDIAGTSGTAFCSTASSLSPTSMGGGNDANDAVTSRTDTAGASASWTSVVIAMGTDFIKANICNGKTIFGRTGTAICNSIFGDLTASGANRNLGSTQATLSGEVNLGTCSSGGYTTRASCEAASVTWTPSAMGANYRIVADDRTDDDGYLGNGNTTYALRPT